MSEYLAEKEILGATHAEVAAYLLGLWGFTDSVVELLLTTINPVSPPTLSSPSHRGPCCQCIRGCGAGE